MSENLKGGASPRGSLHSEKDSPMTKLEEVARALYSRGGEPRPGVDPLVPWPELDPKYQKYWLELARAALEALRKPSEGMIEAGKKAHMKYDYVQVPRADIVSDILGAMVDAALTEERAEE